MEGIFDGRAADDCFYCTLLEPGIEPCPHCAGRMRWLPAALLSEPELRIQLAREATATTKEALYALFTMLHRFAPASLEALEELGEPSLSELRTRWFDAMRAAR